MVKYDYMYFLETAKKSSLKSKIEDIVSSERTKSENFAKFQFKLKIKRFIEKVNFNDDPQSIVYRKEVEENCNLAVNYLREIYLLNEYFGLLLVNNCNRSYGDCFNKSNYSFKPNLLKSFLKSLDMQQMLEEIIKNGNSQDHYFQLVLLIKKFNLFVKNLKHMLNYLDIK